MNRQRGFNLVEMAVVLLIIGLILGGIFKGQSALVQGGRTHDAIQIATDLSGIMIEFKNQYHYLPGDFPANGEIPGLSADCSAGGARGGNGNGLIGGSTPTALDPHDESSCIAEQLSKAGFIKGSDVAMQTAFGPVRVIARRSSLSALSDDSVLSNRRFMNVIEFDNLPCDVAMEIDRKIDNSDLSSGNVQSDAASAACSPDGGTVLHLGVGIQ